MKIILFATIIIFFSLNLSAQYKETNAWYIRPVLGNGNYKLLGISGNFISKKNYSLAVFYNYETRTSPNTPDDYLSGLRIFGDGLPKIKITTTGIMYGRVFRDVPQILRAKLQGGILFGKIERPHTFKRHSGGLITSGYYTFNYDKKYLVGLILNPCLEILFTRYFAVNIGVHANINPQDITAGFDVGLLFGYLRPRLSND